MDVHFFRCGSRAGVRSQSGIGYLPVAEKASDFFHHCRWIELLADTVRDRIGVFTIIVLSRDSVREVYSRTEAG